MGTHWAAGSEEAVRRRWEESGGRVPHGYRRRGHNRLCAELSPSVEERRGGPRVSGRSNRVTVTPRPADELRDVCDLGRVSHPLLFAHESAHATERDVRMCRREGFHVASSQR
ncbi:hypothetical protein PR202_gb15570 [Eleusine coracana subsp. coracana]|uniref:Uncharacterized protein n=1 Tax=Eleusine coracana subsp. coracana TaxID=191504 RepID=A0AAV5EZH2_ELECO|nr:hypothetical protein PR202_gb15570 [Eleusine coracana subsp. coracana]